MVNIRDFQSFDVSSILTICSYCGEGRYPSRSHKPTLAGSTPVAATLIEENMKGENKMMLLITGATMRSVVNQANELGVQKEDIVQLFHMAGQIYLIYYK